MSKDHNELAQKLLRIKQAMEQAIEQRAQLTGKLEHLLEELEKDYQCKTLKEADAMLNKLEKIVDGLFAVLNERIEKFQEKYGT